MFKFLYYLASFDAADGHAFLLHLPPIRRTKLLYLPAPDILLGQVPECIGGVNLVEDVRVIRGFTTPSPARTSENATASISWSIAPVLSFQEASRTAMYAGTFVLLLPAVAYWGSLVVDLTLFGALLPPAIYGLLQKILPTSVKDTGFSTLLSRLELSKRIRPSSLPR